MGLEEISFDTETRFKCDFNTASCDKELVFPPFREPKSQGQVLGNNLVESQSQLLGSAKSTAAAAPLPLMCSSSKRHMAICELLLLPEIEGGDGSEEITF